MPQATNGNQIVASSQVGTGVITSTGILDGTIVDADVSASAAIAGSKLQALSVGANAGVIPSTGITNAHLSGSAGITDANLAVISTAGKVNGAALTSLGSIPAGAGIIPAANAPASNIKAGASSYATSTASGNFNIAHGLGKIPAYIRVYFFSSLGTTLQIAFLHVCYDGTTTTIQGLQGDGTTSLSATQVARLNDINVGTRYASFTVTFDATNIIFAMTNVNGPTRTYQILWEAVG